MRPNITYNLSMTSNIRKTLVSLFTLLVLANPSHALEVYYEENELTREIIVYDLSEKQDYLIKVYEPCPTRCPNETLSEGWNEPDPVREDPLESNESMMSVDPVLLQMIMNRQFSGPYRY